MPTVVCGPAGGGLHTDLEWVELEPVRAYTETLTGLIPRVFVLDEHRDERACSS